MKMVDVEYWQGELNKALMKEGITDQKFFDFMEGKIKRFSLDTEEFGWSWSVFPLTNKDDILVDIRMVVPTICDVKSLCVNIHEYVHAYETYLWLGKVYVWRIDESEQKACNAEKRYLKSFYTARY